MPNPFDVAVIDVATERLAELNADPVDGDQLLHDISSFIARYLHCSEHQRALLAAWVVHTYCHSAAQFTPYLSIQSAEKQSGKTRCLLLLHLLCDYPALTAGFTASSLFRLMGNGINTLLLDDCQASIGTRNRSKAPVLRAILAAGAHAEPARFAAHDRNRFCPKAFAGKASLPEDLDGSLAPSEVSTQSPEITNKNAARDGVTPADRASVSAKENPVSQPGMNGQPMPSNYPITKLSNYPRVEAAANPPANAAAEGLARLKLLHDSLKLQGRHGNLPGLAAMFTPAQLKAKLDWGDAHSPWRTGMRGVTELEFDRIFQLVPADGGL